MQIQIIKSSNVYNKYNSINKSNNLKQSQNKTTNNNLFEVPRSYIKINFKGKSIEKMWEEYNWYINHDKTPAIMSFLKINETPEILNEFLTTILKTEDRSKELLSSIAYCPRKAFEIMDNFKTKLPANSEHLYPFFGNSTYYAAYTKFIDWKVNEARSVEDLLRIRPDWRGEVLLKKYQDLHGNDNFEIGNIPREFPNKHLTQLVDYLSQQMEFGIKSKKKIPSLTLDNRTYEFAYFTEGKSDKNVFGIFTPEGKKFVLKMSTPERRSLDDGFALGTLAKIDSYLTYNRSRNSAPLCYYNHNKNFSVYKYIEHIPTTYIASDITEISKNMPDFKALGLTYNDTVGEKNYFLMDTRSNTDLKNSEGFEDGIKRKEWISVDNDHVTYGNALQPLISKYHTSLPNAMQMFN